ncbi:MAG: restriction endonuclease subunit R [Helicobacteraceae bacterium]|nr:restriction endonuclease subunit R [Helicobacteraceae bacterium]
MKFNEKLVLNSYMFSLFGVKDLEELSRSFKEETRNEKVDEEGVSMFYYAISSRLFDDTKIDKIKLLEYDENIVRHTKNLKQAIKWKYFQYLTLLFTEIYLDMYCSSKETLLKNLNEYVKEFNEALPKKEKIAPFELKNLNKLAFWNATGSGKTLLMHINIMQFNHYNESKINKTILITPNAGLSSQHLKEFESNGLEAEMFSEESRGLFEKEMIEVLEISKLKESKGETTFAVDSFGDDNLVFIDEGHRGAKGEEWKTNRDALSANGFAFEYSATFGQAIASATKKRGELTQEYSKSILFDYSYKYFKNDGFGKDYTILNLKEEPSKELEYNYFVGALLSFYQQKKIFRDNPKKMRTYNIENPLMIFVGGKVSQSLSKQEGSDITNILKFLEKFISQKELSKQSIRKVRENRSGILTASNIDIFTGKFDYLSSINIDENAIYQDMLELIFNAGSGILHLEELKGCDGEIGLKVGEGDYFGVINIGITNDFKKLCVEQKLDLRTKDFNESLFLNINEKKSKISMLIGSRKFTEGWSSWRVSTMGLLNMGKSEGAQVIQLFGRGVRLKGCDMSLKRSTFYGKGLEAKYLNMEILNIFGLKANYMEEFRKYLENEGVQNSETFDINLPVLRDDRYKDKHLKVLRLKDGKQYKENKIDELEYTQNSAITKKVVINLYAKAQVIGLSVSSDYAQNADTYKFDTRKELSFLDKDKLFLDLIAYKNEKSYFNLNINKRAIDAFTQNSDWYVLEAPKDYFFISKFSDFERIQDAFSVLLKKYVDEFYKYHKNSFEKDFMEYRELDDNDANFVEEYKVSCEEEGNSDLIEKLKILKERLSNNDLEYKIDLSYFKSFVSSKHLYNPLLFKEQKKIKISPIELNKGEMNFVEDLELYLEKNRATYENDELFLLRNKSKVGIGFFEDGGFYPDFIMWIKKDDKQYITFIDPKGIRNSNPRNDPKMELATSIKDIEAELGDTNTVLNSFILSNTSLSTLNELHTNLTHQFFENKNVLFQVGSHKNSYIGVMFDKILS